MPNSGDRFNGAFQAGQGINDTMFSGNVFKVSPRLGVVYDVSGSGTTIVRGGFGIFYDRPQGNIVFDTINNAPGLLQPTVQWGLMQNLAAGANDPYPALGMQPTAYDFTPPKVYAWNAGIQHKLFKSVTLDIAYVGSSSKNLIEQEQINALPLGTLFKAENQDPTRTPSSTPGATALTTDLLRPYQGYGGIRWWDATGYSNYHALQTSVNRRFDNGLMFSVFYVWSKTLGLGSTDWSSRIPFASDAENKRVNYSYTDYDRPHNFVINAIYQTPKVASGVLGVIANNWQVSGVYRWNSGRPYAINWSIPGGIGNNNLTGGTDVTAPCRRSPAIRAAAGAATPTSRSTPPASPRRRWAARVTSRRASSCTRRPINNLDLSISKSFPIAKSVRIEIRADAFNALNHTQFTGVNNTANFASLTDHTITNLPYNAAGEHDARQQRLRHHQRCRAAADHPADDSSDVLASKGKPYGGPAPAGAGPLRFRPTIELARRRRARRGFQRTCASPTSAPRPSRSRSRRRCATPTAATGAASCARSWSSRPTAASSAWARWAAAARRPRLPSRA